MEGGVLTSTGSFQAQALCCTNSREIMQHPSLVCSLWQTKERARQNTSTKPRPLEGKCISPRKLLCLQYAAACTFLTTTKISNMPHCVFLIISCSHLAAAFCSGTLAHE